MALRFLPDPTPRSSALISCHLPLAAIQPHTDPYAAPLALGLVRPRFEGSRENFEFKNSGDEVTTDHLCFLRVGRDTPDWIGKL